jgi:predicted thioesterase
LTVTDAVTAIAVGSGDMPVLATPMMMALMENAAMLEKIRTFNKMSRRGQENL